MASKKFMEFHETRLSTQEEVLLTRGKKQVELAVSFIRDARAFEKEKREDSEWNYSDYFYKRSIRGNYSEARLYLGDARRTFAELEGIAKDGALEKAAYGAAERAKSLSKRIYPRSVLQVDVEISSSYL